jgi:predicted nucleic acid-binding Zn ribbon protein
MKHSPPQHIGEVINSYLRNRNWTQRLNGYDVFELWEEFIPKKIALNAKPIKIQDHNLFIRVKNHIWANEVRIRNGEIINAINKNIGNELIRGIVIRIDTKFFKKSK